MERRRSAIWRECWFWVGYKVSPSGAQGLVKARSRFFLFLKQDRQCCSVIGVRATLFGSYPGVAMWNERRRRGAARSAVPPPQQAEGSGSCAQGNVRGGARGGRAANRNARGFGGRSRASSVGVTEEVVRGGRVEGRRGSGSEELAGQNPGNPNPDCADQLHDKDSDSSVGNLIQSISQATASKDIVLKPISLKRKLTGWFIGESSKKRKLDKRKKGAWVRRQVQRCRNPGVEGEDQNMMGVAIQAGRSGLEGVEGLNPENDCPLPKGDNPVDSETDQPERMDEYVKGGTLDLLHLITKTVDGFDDLEEEMKLIHCQAMKFMLENVEILTDEFAELLDLVTARVRDQAHKKFIFLYGPGHRPVSDMGDRSEQAAMKSIEKQYAVIPPSSDWMNGQIEKRSLQAEMKKWDEALDWWAVKVPDMGTSSAVPAGGIPPPRSEDVLLDGVPAYFAGLHEELLRLAEEEARSANDDSADSLPFFIIGPLQGGANTSFEDTNEDDDGMMGLELGKIAVMTRGATLLLSL
ncbi:hypothetical protein MLD38_032047 [Melastoma candidum]|uniref:Uncharacterized protein n=1 Tax=Melastoma candidum TaxID=119954 RepID=A0ACB9M2K8_9MYRT|nr:hypothetical protein MLD38_032047 [Melastoma candidum]